MGVVQDTIAALALVTDRTEADTDQLAALNCLKWDDMTAEEQGVWYEAKGGYTATDLNRVGRAANYLYSIVTEMGYAADGYIQLRTDWVRTNVPTDEALSEYIGSINVLADVFVQLPALLSLPNDISTGMSVQEANDIEKLLIVMGEWVELVRQNYFYSGQVRCGQMWTQFGG